jgi:hypothetical protein
MESDESLTDMKQIRHANVFTREMLQQVIQVEPGRKVEVDR